MDEPVERVEISGEALSLILREFGSSKGDCDGLLFGRLQRKVRHNLQDANDSPATSKEVTAVISGCCCSGALMSFYDGAGCIDEQKLARLIGKRRRWGSDPLIGWLVGRRNSSFRPSMRESYVTAMLSSRDGSSPEQRNGGGPKVASLGLAYSASSSSSGSSNMETEVPGDWPCLFMLLTETRNVNRGCIQTLDYRTFQYQRRTGLLHPRLLVVRNVGKASISLPEESLYSSFAPVAQLPWFSTKTSPAPTTHMGGEEDEVNSWNHILQNETGVGAASRLVRQKGAQAQLDMFTDGFSIELLQNMVGSGGGLQELELLYAAVLGRMQKISSEVRESSRLLDKQEKLNQKLRNAVHRHRKC